MKMNKKDKDKIPNITNENEQEYWLDSFALYKRSSNY